MTAAIALRQLLLSVHGWIPTFHQHLPGRPPVEFAWFILADSEAEETFDDGDGPDRFYFDLEVYAGSLDRLDAHALTLEAIRGWCGVVPGSTARMQLVELTGQREDYEPQASAKGLPAYLQAFRVIIHGYDPEP